MAELLHKRPYFSTGKSTETPQTDSVGYQWLKRPLSKARMAGGDYRHVQVFDERPEADYPVFVTQREFALLFPAGEDMEFEDDLIKRLG